MEQRYMTEIERKRDAFVLLRNYLEWDRKFFAYTILVYTY